MRHNCGRSEDLFSKLRRKSDPGSGLAVSIYQSAIFSALVLIIGVVLHTLRITRIAERKRHIGTMKTVSARQANHEFSDLLSRVEHGEEILITKASRSVKTLSSAAHDCRAQKCHSTRNRCDGEWPGPGVAPVKRFKRGEMHES